MRVLTMITTLSLIVIAGILPLEGYLDHNTRRICVDTSEIYVPQPLPKDSIRFAAIGDYGIQGVGEQRVANIVADWEPDFVISLGDNNYSRGSAETIDNNIGQYFHSFIGSYNGRYGNGATTNRFYPVLGNHDWMYESGQAYFDYFSLPGNERYYTFIQGPVQFFALSSNPQEPDGNTVDSIQARWLRDQLAASTAPFQVVYMHHPPYSSGQHGSNPALQWSFQTWGTDAVLSGHDHTYERFAHDGIPYFVNGLGGQEPYKFNTLLEMGSQKQYDCNYGAMLIEANAETMTFRFITIEGIVIDTYTIYAIGASNPTGSS